MAEKNAIVASKEQLLSNQVLVHYDPSLELVVACDASAYGLGAVLSHRLPDGTERPIGYLYLEPSQTQKRNIHRSKRKGLCACLE